jgi:hypothetical protein
VSAQDRLHSATSLAAEMVTSKQPLAYEPGLRVMWIIEWAATL